MLMLITFTYKWRHLNACDECYDSVAIIPNRLCIFNHKISSISLYICRMLYHQLFNLGKQYFCNGIPNISFTEIQLLSISNIEATRKLDRNVTSQSVVTILFGYQFNLCADLYIGDVEEYAFVTPRRFILGVYSLSPTPHKTSYVVLLSRKTSYRKISWSLEAARFGFRLFQLLLNLTVTSAATLPRCLSNFRAKRSL